MSITHHFTDKINTTKTLVGAILAVLPYTHYITCITENTVAKV